MSRLSDIRLYFLASTGSVSPDWGAALEMKNCHPPHRQAQYPDSHRTHPFEPHLELFRVDQSRVRAQGDFVVSAIRILIVHVVTAIVTARWTLALDAPKLLVIPYVSLPSSCFRSDSWPLPHNP